MRKHFFAAATAAGSFAFLFTSFLSTSALAAPEEDIRLLRQEIQAMKQSYEERIHELETKLAQIEEAPSTATAVAPKAAPAHAHAAGAERRVLGNRFNPSIGVILNGQFRNYSEDGGEIAGFAVGHEGERGREGLSVDHTELNFTASVDDKFSGSVTAAIAEHESETEIELEEAYVKTLPGLGLPDGLSVKGGRALWTLGYLNEHHLHADDFADRPLPYRVFLDNHFNDDGVEVSYVLPTDVYAEVGGGLFRSEDFPGGGARGEGAGSHTLFARVGGDIGQDQSWRLGGTWLASTAEGRTSNEDAVLFTGDADLYLADLRYVWAPTGNPRAQEVILQAEYFWRGEDGFYEDAAAGTGAVPFDDTSHGWYAQGVYKFAEPWRAGYRFTQLRAADAPAGLAGSALDAGGHDPYIHSVMADWTNSEFSRLRLQYNHDRSVADETDNQIVLQYIMSLGAHPAHKY